MTLKKINIFIIMLFTLSGLTLNAQNMSINKNGIAPDPSAMLDINSKESGILIPRMSKAERDAIVSPDTSLLIYQTNNTPGFYFYDGLNWVPVHKEQTCPTGMISVNDAFCIDSVRSATAVSWENAQRNCLNRGCELPTGLQWRGAALINLANPMDTTNTVEEWAAGYIYYFDNANTRYEYRANTVSRNGYFYKHFTSNALKYRCIYYLK